MVIKLAKVPLLVWVLPLVMGIGLPSRVTEIAPAGKSVPVIAICVPAGPVVGEMVRAAGAVTVKVAVAVALPAVTVIVCAPAAVPSGIVMVLRKIPVERVVISPPVGVSAVVESSKKVNAVLAGKFPPLMLMAVPAGPVAGLRGSRVAPAVMVRDA
jgi:hypothetical protein